MNEEERKANLTAVKQHLQKNREALQGWSEKAAESAANEFLSGKLLLPDQAEFARKIIARDLHDAVWRSFRHVLAELPRLPGDRQG